MVAQRSGTQVAFCTVLECRIKHSRLRARLSEKIGPVTCTLELDRTGQFFVLSFLIGPVFTCRFRQLSSALANCMRVLHNRPLFSPLLTLILVSLLACSVPSYLSMSFPVLFGIFIGYLAAQPVWLHFTEETASYRGERKLSRASW